MITLLTGVPGSGKTYLAVIRMSEDKKPIHTNIELNNNFVKPHTFFVWDDFFLNLKISILIEMSLKNSLICQNSLVYLVYLFILMSVI